ncbi:MAG: HAD family hydrolase [Pseudomonadota bacterium]
MRIAMWSGPRNLSTAMMRSFGARADCTVMDEPFYGAYLATSGITHPMREAIIAHYETDPEAVAAQCLAAPGSAAEISYQKHMPHHMLPEFPTDWMSAMTNAFLIRDPLQVAASYEAKREAPTKADLGVEQQLALFEDEAERLGHAPPVVDAADINADPKRTLTALCRALGIAFDPAMLSWAAGPRETDGIWADIWYASVHKSTGFDAGPARDQSPVSDHAKRLADEMMPAYRRLRGFAL